MKTITTTVYEFDELSDKAKKKARDWYREEALQDEWWDSTYEDAANIGLKITSFDLDRNRHACGEFIGTAAQCGFKILNEHGKDCETFKTAEAFLDARNLLDQTAEDYEEKEKELAGEFLKSILEDYSIMLQKECEYLLSNESGKRMG